MNDSNKSTRSEVVEREVREIVQGASPPTKLPEDVRQKGRQLLVGATNKRTNHAALWMAAAVTTIGFLVAVLLSDLLGTERQEAAMDVTPEQEVTAAPPKRTNRKGLVLSPAPSGWLERDSNPWRAQGYFYVDASQGSEIVRPERSSDDWEGGRPWTSSGDGRLCLRGSSTAVQEGDFESYWGVVAGFELCHTGDEGEPPNTTLPVADCPWGDWERLQGLRFDLEGPRIPSELRLVFTEIGSDENAFVAFVDSESDTYEARIEDARASYLKPPRGVRRQRLRGAEWLIPSRMGHTTSFDFCISNIQLF